MWNASGNRRWKRMAAMALLGACLSLPVAARTMMEYGSMPMREPQSEAAQPMREPVGAGESQQRSVQESDRQGRVAEPPLTVPGFENDYDDADGYTPQRTGITSFYWLLGALALVAVMTVVYTLGMRRHKPEAGRR